MPSTLTESPAWRALVAHERTASADLVTLFAGDAGRFTRFSIEHAGLLFDYSKQRVTDETMRLLVALAEARDVRGWTARLMSGEKVNFTEARAALHTALRSGERLVVDGRDVTDEIARVRTQMRVFSSELRAGTIKGATGRAITDVINIGIGGSDLGPALAVEALKPYSAPTPRVHFMSNVDGAHVESVLKPLDPETTLAVVASKTFSTQETLTNARAVRAWLARTVGEDTSAHFAAVTANAGAAHEFGIESARIFEFWEWVGGRYSLWSAIGLPIAIAVGMDGYESLCAGAREMDRHFAEAPLERNMPVVMALLGMWNGDFLGAATQAVLPYDMRLKRLPDYLQQLEMESNGKRATREGGFADYATCPVVWGGPGTNGQHAFYQMLHQGTQVVPADFIVCCRAHDDLPEHHAIMLANCFAQAEALMRGKSKSEARADMQQQGLSAAEIERLLPHRMFPGNRQSSTLVLEELSPRALGALIALYEHKVFVQSVIWDINAFDQWGVELGKRLADRILPELTASAAAEDHDGSTNALINYTKTRYRRKAP